MRVKIYFNLHKKVWSVMTYTYGKGWRVDFHSDGRTLFLKDVIFKVSEAGRQRVLRERQKNVHAFAVGTLIEKLPSLSSMDMKPVSYNPYKASTFMCENQPIMTAKYASFDQNRQVLVSQNS